MSIPDFDFQQAFNRVYDRITELHTDVTTTKTKLEILVGNGQPGEIDKIKGRLSLLEEVKNKAAGYVMAITGVGAVVSLVGHFLLDFFRTKH